MVSYCSLARRLARSRYDTWIKTIPRSYHVIICIFLSCIAIALRLSTYDNIKMFSMYVMITKDIFFIYLWIISSCHETYVYNNVFASYHQHDQNRLFAHQFLQVSICFNLSSHLEDLLSREHLFGLVKRRPFGYDMRKCKMSCSGCEFL